MTDAPSSSDLINNSASVELSSNRTSLSFERTRMATDRTLMATVRTSLSLISFGFTLNEVFQQLQEKQAIFAHDAVAHYFALALVCLGIVSLFMGILNHNRFIHSLVDRKERLYAMNLVHRTAEYKATPTFITALLLLTLGVVAAGSIIWRSLL